MNVNYDLLLIDGKNLLYRAADVYNMLVIDYFNTKMNVGGIYGFLQILKNVRKKYQGRIIIIWDGKNNFRYKLYPEYKAKRKLNNLKMFIDNLDDQELRLMSILKFLGVEQYISNNCEADDVIANLVNFFKNKKIAIYSNDSDLRQLVTDKVQVIAPCCKGKDCIFDVANVNNKYKILNPGQLADYKAISGDSSDNIPGIIGIGPKTASKLLLKYKNIEHIIEAARINKDWPISEKFRYSILDNIEKLRLFLKLTTLNKNADMKMVNCDKNQKKVVNAFLIYKFKNLLEPLELSKLMEIGNESKIEKR